MKGDLIYSTDDVLKILDALLDDRGGSWWNRFFADRSKPCPFFVQWPDENLVGYFDAGFLRSGSALELGCGNGRNAVYLANKGCVVDAVDFSQEAITWAKERTSAEGIKVNYLCQSIFDLEVEQGSYDLVYDCGCFHHVLPHRRKSYVDLVYSSLKANGYFGLVCFRPEGGSGLTDWQVYEQRKMGGGLGYREEQLRALFGSSFGIVELRQMKEQEKGCCLFGKEFLWVVLMQKGHRVPLDEE